MFAYRDWGRKFH